MMKTPTVILVLNMSIMIPNAQIDDRSVNIGISMEDNDDNILNDDGSFNGYLMMKIII